MCASSTSGCAFTVQYYKEHSSTVFMFKPSMSESKCKSRSDVTGTTVLFKALYYKIKGLYFFVFVFFYVLFV